MDLRVQVYVLLSCLITIATCTNPYTPGKYRTGVYIIDPKTQGSPLHSSVYYPLSADKYNVITFIGGFNGYMVAEAYADFLKAVASHGYIVIGMDPIHVEDGTDRKLNFHTVGGKVKNVYQRSKWFTRNRMSGVDIGDAAKYLEQLEWLRLYVLNVSSAQLDWSMNIFMCQSSGCDASLRIMKEFPDMAKAVLFFDPVSEYSRKLEPFKSQIKFLAHMSQLSEHFPECCIKGIGWKRIYEVMECTKVRLETNMTGHCDMLTEKDWTLCHDTGLCRTTDDKHLVHYQQFLASLSHAFIQWTVHGRGDMEKYVVDTANMPYEILELVYDTSC